MSNLDDRELFCKAVFDRYLDETLGLELVWTIPAHDPPDLWLDLGETRFAVEVTSTPRRFGEPWADAPAQETYLLACRELLRKVEETALRQNALRGRYGVSFAPAGAVGRKSFPKWRAHVESALLGYILGTRDLREAPGRTIQWDHKPVCTVGKYSDRKDRLALSAVHLQCEGGVRESVAKLLRVVLEKKTKRLRSAGVDPPRILVILNTEGSAYKRPDLFVESLEASRGRAGFFHTVFLVEGDGTGHVLRSSDTRWAARPRIAPPRASR